MKKNKRDGWSARRRNKRDNDRIARASGYADHRSILHAHSVKKLQMFLVEMFVADPERWKECSWDPGYWRAEGSKLYDARAVADAIGMSPKGVRWLGHTRQLVSEPPLSEKSRKLLFKASSVHNFLRSRRTRPFGEVLRHAAIAANPRGARGLGLTKNEVAHELAFPKRAVERYLACGLLKRSAASSQRLTLITYESMRDLEHCQPIRFSRVGDVLVGSVAIAIKGDLAKARKKLLASIIVSSGH